MSDCFWRPISVDCVDPASFPEVALYLKTGGKYVLYKDEQRRFCEADQRRLENSRIEFLYVRSGDLKEVNSYLEQNLSRILDRNDVTGAAKGLILYQTSVNYVIDIFESPEQAACLERCRSLIRHMMSYVADEEHALESLRTIAAHNDYIFSHSVQVTALNLLIHEKIFRLTQEEMIEVGIGSLLHDFGMTFIADEILEKPGALSEAEYLSVKEHAHKGYEFLKNLGLGEVALHIVRYHHERFDGQGYPSGRQQKDIPRSAQLAAICDTYSALTSERGYRPAYPQAEALRMMREEAGNGLFNYEYFRQFEGVMTTTRGVSDQERTHLASTAPGQGGAHDA